MIGTARHSNIDWFITFVPSYLHLHLLSQQETPLWRKDTSSLYIYKWKVKGKSLSCVRLFETPWTAAYQAPPSMGFSRQEYWIGLPLLLQVSDIINAKKKKKNDSQNFYHRVGGLPSWLSGKEPAFQYRRLKRCRFDPWVRKIPCRSER